jgi:hypothetical protein
LFELSCSLKLSICDIFIFLFRVIELVNRIQRSGSSYRDSLDYVFLRFPSRGTTGIDDNFVLRKFGYLVTISAVGMNNIYFINVCLQESS